MFPFLLKYDPGAVAGDTGAEPVVEVGGGEPVVEIPAEPVAEPVVEPGEAWNGEVEHLVKRPWAVKLTPEERADLEGGVRTKNSAYTRGVQKAAETLKQKETAWEAERAAARTALESATKARDFFTELLAEDDKAGPLNAKLEEAVTRLAGVEESLRKATEENAGFRTAARSAETEKTLSADKAAYPDVYDDFQAVDGAEPTGMYAVFCRLRASGVSESVAAAAARADHKERNPVVVAPPAGPREVVLPPGVALMGSGGGPRPSAATRTPNEDYEAAMARAKAAAMTEDDE